MGCESSNTKAEAPAEEAKPAEAAATLAEYTKPLEITWMRHGESVSNIRTMYFKHLSNPVQDTDSSRFHTLKSVATFNPALTRLGVAQARQAVLDNPELFKTIADKDGPYKGRIHCSYLHRAIETACTVAATIEELFPGAGDSITIVPIPYITERCGGMTESNPDRWAEQWNPEDHGGKQMASWDKEVVTEQMAGAFRALGIEWPKGPKLDPKHILPPPTVLSSPVPEKSHINNNPDVNATFGKRVLSFFEYAQQNKFFEDGSFFAIAHGGFIRGIGTYTEERVGKQFPWSEQFMEKNLYPVDDDKTPFLTKHDFKENCAIATLHYNPSSLGVLAMPNPPYNGDERIERKFPPPDPSALSLLEKLQPTCASPGDEKTTSKTSSEVNAFYTMGELGEMKDLDIPKYFGALEGMLAQDSK